MDSNGNLLFIDSLKIQKTRDTIEVKKKKHIVW